MDTLYQKALNGTLRSPAPTGTPGNVTFFNQTEIPILAYWVDYVGRHVGGPLSMMLVQPGGSSTWSATPNQHFVFLAAASGAFVCALQTQAGVTSYPITCQMLVSPNDVGAFPVPGGTTLIPTSSPRVLVGCGLLTPGSANSPVVTREQFWSRSPDSYCLAPGQTTTIGSTDTAGMQQTTSEQTSVSESLGLSASAGWGPVSTSVSSSLSLTSNAFQQVTVTSESTRYQSVVMTNATSATQMFLKWRLTDVITVFSPPPNMAPLSAIIQAEAPEIVAGPYDPNAPHPPAEAVTVTREMLAQAPRPVQGGRSAGAKA